PVDLAAAWTESRWAWISAAVRGRLSARRPAEWRCQARRQPAAERATLSADNSLSSQLHRRKAGGAISRTRPAPQRCWHARTKHARHRQVIKQSWDKSVAGRKTGILVYGPLQE